MIRHILMGVLLMLAIPVAAYTESISLSKYEAALLQMAYVLGKETKYPEVIQAIMLNETVAGRYGSYGDTKFKNWKHRSYGVMQIRFTTAKDLVGMRYGRSDFMEDIDLLNHLTHNHSFNIRLAVTYYNHLLGLFKGDWEKALLAYNVGQGNVLKKGLSFDPNGYLKKAKGHMVNTVAQFNKANGNGQTIIYTVKKGDTLYKIAKRILGDGKRWKEIHKLNSWIIPERMEIGTEIVINK